MRVDELRISHLYYLFLRIGKGVWQAGSWCIQDLYWIGHQAFWSCLESAYLETKIYYRNMNSTLLVKGKSFSECTFHRVDRHRSSNPS